MKTSICGPILSIFLTCGIQAGEYRFGDWTVHVQPERKASALPTPHQSPKIEHAIAVSAVVPGEEEAPGVEPRTIEPVSAVVQPKPAASTLPVVVPGPVAPQPVVKAPCPEVANPLMPQVQVNTPIVIQMQWNDGWDGDYPSYRNGLSGLYSSPAYGPWRPYWTGGLRIHRSF